MSIVPRLPNHYPDWVGSLVETYASGASCVFLLHGNVHDLVVSPDGAGYGSLSAFLAGGLFSTWDLVLRYDLGDGLRPVAGSDAERQSTMASLLSEHLGDRSRWPRDPDDAFSVLDQLIERFLLMTEPAGGHDLAVLLPFAAFLVPPSPADQLTAREAARLVHLLEWARSPLVRRVNMAFILWTEDLSQVNGRLLDAPQIANIEVPLPSADDRRRLIEHRGFRSDSLSALQFVDLTNGLTLSSIERLVTLHAPQESSEVVTGAEGEPVSAPRPASSRLDVHELKQLKKELIERQCNGLLEFIEPKRTLDMVVGHDAAKRRLREDGELIAKGHLEIAPMGYLICGPVGTGKSFLAECYAGSVGMPCVTLKNFRSKYVGETEANLQRLLSVLRSLGPVLVVIDEADAALGTREQGGDSGVSARVFSMIAAQMGDTRYRGKILWMLLTARPDRLPIDLKRQGRAEVHIPLFYPQTSDELSEMFVVMGRKNGITLDRDALPELGGTGGGVGRWSGSDVESIVIAAHRRALLDGRQSPSPEDLQIATDAFMPSVQGVQKQKQELAAVLECTDRAFLPDHWRERIDEPDGRAELLAEYRRLNILLGG